MPSKTTRLEGADREAKIDYYFSHLDVMAAHAARMCRENPASFWTEHSLEFPDPPSEGDQVAADLTILRGFIDKTREHDRVHQAAFEAAARLEEAGYAGAGDVCGSLDGSEPGAGWRDGLEDALADIKAMLEAENDLGGFLFRKMILGDRQSLAAAEAAMSRWSHDPEIFEQAKALRAYAATQTLPEWADTPATLAERAAVLFWWMEIATNRGAVEEASQRRSELVEMLGPWLVDFRSRVKASPEDDFDRKLELLDLERYRVSLEQGQ
jgi:hypothetical protein